QFRTGAPAALPRLDRSVAPLRTVARPAQIRAWPRDRQLAIRSGWGVALSDTISRPRKARKKRPLRLSAQGLATETRQSCLVRLWYRLPVWLVCRLPHDAGGGATLGAAAVHEAFRAAALRSRGRDDVFVVDAPDLRKGGAGSVEGFIFLRRGVVREAVNDAAVVLPLAGGDQLVVQPFDHGVERIGILDLDRIAGDDRIAVLDAAAVKVPAGDVSGGVDRAAGVTGVLDTELDFRRIFELCAGSAGFHAARVCIIAGKNVRTVDA